MTSCPNLKVLWLSENPISAYPNYRMFVLKILPNLTKLDEVEVTPEEVQIASTMTFNEEDMSISRNGPSYDPPTLESQEEFDHKEPYSYESPQKAPSYEPNEQITSQSVQRTPPEEIKQSSYQPPVHDMQQYPPTDDQPQAPSNIKGSTPAYWSKGPSGGDLYAGGVQPQNYDIPKRPQTSGPFYGEAPPLRYGMNETGNYLPPVQPRLMHAHSTPPVTNSAPTPQGGKYKNENIL